MQKLILRHGDCVDVLKGYEDGSIGAFICDPPYDLTAVSRGGSARQAGTGPFGRHELDTVAVRGGFMGKTWDGTGIAFSARLWDEVYRVLCPGGVIKAFSGTRTFHRMAAAIQDAGFRDLRLEVWSYGSGFPKSLNIGKALDKAAGAEREVIGTYTARGFSENSPTADGRNQWAAGEVVDKVGLRTAPATDTAQLWEGWGTALKPSWEPVCVARKVDGRCSG